MHTRRSLQSSMFLVVVAALALAWAATAAAAEFPATGQTHSYRPGDDGDIEAGATLRYRDNGDGTITDRNTGLVWEKKSDDSSIHDVGGNTYTWDQAFLQHVATLNTICANDETVPCSHDGDCGAALVFGRCGFAGKRDWRVPNYKELTSILNLKNRNPAVSRVFNNTCAPGVTVLTGSCTAASYYWSSTTESSV